MSENGTAGPLQFPAQVPAPIPTQLTAQTAPEATRGIAPEQDRDFVAEIDREFAAGSTPGTAAGIDRAAGDAVPAPASPRPVAMLVVDGVTGTVTAANPAGRARLTGPSGLQLSRWLTAVASVCTDDDADDLTAVRLWQGIDGATAAPVTLLAQCTPLSFRSHRCVLVVLREDAAPHAPSHGHAAVPAAVFTMDAVGRIDSWGPSARRMTGFPADLVIGSDTTLIHPSAARIAGEPHLALTEAYRHGEHHAEGWRLCSDGRVMWAQVVTGALYDGLGRLVGFAASMSDLTARHRLVPSTATGLPAPRGPLAAGSTRPAPSRPGGRADGRRPGNVPGQRRPSNS